MLGHQLAVLKEEHARELAQLKNDHETQLKSLEKELNQKEVMAAETEHEV
jgi:hypothetical protein